MMYPKNEWCLGCSALELPNFVGKYNCEGSYPPRTKKTKESINGIHKILDKKENVGMQERIKI